MIAREFRACRCPLSSDVVPELREYERGTTTTANAFVQPLMERYVARLEEALGERGFRGRFHLMQSSGGTASPAMARAFPIRLLESGPAGGGLVTAFFGARVGHPDVISFDMGGTTAKVCLIRDGRPDVAPMMEAARVHRFKRGSGLPIKAPVIDMIEIGAGGGSIARVDPLGLLKVGPHSAGADPGPACYGQGGESRRSPTPTWCSATSTRASSWAGACRSTAPPPRRRWDGWRRRSGSRRSRRVGRVRHRVREHGGGRPRAHRGEGARPAALRMVGFGGAGPAHAARVARILGVREVIVPPASGVAAALGFLVAPLSFEFSSSLPGGARRARSRRRQRAPR